VEVVVAVGVEIAVVVEIAVAVAAAVVGVARVEVEWGDKEDLMKQIRLTTELEVVGSDFGR
jgi:hypothetical protein